MDKVISTGWTVREEAKGFVAYYRGNRWWMIPRETRMDAHDYADRLATRWSDEVALFMTSPEWTQEGQEPAFHKGGPWRYTLRDGTTGVFHISKMADAKAALRKELGKKRLPKGMVWEIAK